MALPDLLLNRMQPAAKHSSSIDKELSCIAALNTLTKMNLHVSGQQPAGCLLGLCTAAALSLTIVLLFGHTLCQSDLCTEL